MVKVICIKQILIVIRQFTSKTILLNLVPHYQINNQMNNSHDRTQRQILQYMITVTQKLSRTCRDLSQIGRELLQSLSVNDKHKHKSRADHQHNLRQKDDLNSNLIDDDDDDDDIPNINHPINGRKKIKIKNRIEQAEEEQEEEHPPQPQIKPLPQLPNIKKPEDKPDKQKLPDPHPQQKSQDNKKKLKPISHKPKAPTSSFLLFFKQQQQSIAKSYPNYGVVDLTKVAAKCWNELSVQQKDPYQKLFQVERKKYQEEMEKYRKMFPDEVKMKQIEKKEKKKKRAKERREKQGKQVKEVKQVKQPKQKPVPIMANSDINSYNQVTPGCVKLQDPGLRQIEREAELSEEHEHYIKNEEEMASDELGSLDGESEENSLGEDI